MANGHTSARTKRRSSTATRGRAETAFQAQVLAHVHDAVLATDEYFVVTAWNRAAERMYGWTSEEAIGRRVYDIIRSDFSQAQRADALAELERSGSFSVELVQYRRDGTPLCVAGQTIVLQSDDGRIAGYVSVNRDISEQKRAEDVARRHAARSHLLADVSRAFAEAGLDYATVLKTVVVRTSELIGDLCTAIVPANDGAGRPTVVFHHTDPEALASMTAYYSRWSGSLDTPVLRRVLAGEPVLMAEPSREDILAVATAETRPHLERFPIASVLVLPLRAQGRVIGSLGVARDKRGNPYAPDDQVLLQDIADRAGLTIEHARLFTSVSEQRERLRILSAKLVETQEAERRAVARELHDEVGQLLTSLRFTVEAQERADNAVRQHVVNATSRILERVRDLSLNLRPPMLDDLGLVATLLWHFERYRTQTGIQVQFHHRGVERRFGVDVEMSVFRVIQEALTNVARHAQVAEAYVDLSVEDAILCVRVQDAGCGFDPDASAPSGGLSGMRERALLLGGSLTVTSRVGDGTCLLMALPLPMVPANE